MAKERQLTVRVDSLEEALEDFKNVWKRSEQGEEFNTPIEILGFESSAMLMKTLSPKRLELLKVLHARFD